MLDSAIINGIFVLIAAIIGGVATWQASRNKMRIEQLQMIINCKQDKIDKMQKAIDLLAEQVIAYYWLEDEYVKTLPEYEEKGKKAKSTFRQIVSDASHGYPKMREKDVKSLLEKLSA